MTRTQNLAAAIACLCTATGAHAANIVKNAGFEFPKVAAGNLDRFSTGQTIGKWTVVGASGTVDLITSTYMYEGVTFTAKSGSQWLDLTGASQTVTGVAQTLSTTAGTSYTLSFSVGSVYDPDGQLGVASTVEILVNGKRLMDVRNAEKAPNKAFTWEKFTTTIQATSTKTTLEFLNRDPTNDTCNGIDAVSVTANP